jgi:hypothetical protein
MAKRNEAPMYIHRHIHTYICTQRKKWRENVEREFAGLQLHKLSCWTSLSWMEGRGFEAFQVNRFAKQFSFKNPSFSHMLVFKSENQYRYIYYDSLREWPIFVKKGFLMIFFTIHCHEKVDHPIVGVNFWFKSVTFKRFQVTPRHLWWLPKIFRTKKEQNVWTRSPDTKFYLI